MLLKPNKKETFHPKDLGPDDCLVEYRPPFLNAECEEVVVVQDRILNIYLSELKFSYHSLFSVEHLFAETLIEAAHGYNNNKADTLKQHLEDLRTKRKAAVDLRNQSGDSSDKAITDIEAEIKKVREKYFEAAEKQRDCLKTALQTWKYIKRIRDFQKYSNTSVGLKIKKKKVDVDSEREIYDEEFKITLEEIIRENKNGNNLDAIEETESQLDENIDEDKLEAKLRKTFKKCLKEPHEPDVQLILLDDYPITENVPNNKESTRRNVVASTRVYLRILCNGIEVCKTNCYNLNERFSLEINEIVSLQLTDVPQFVTVEVIEQPKGIQKKKVCELNLKVPPSKSASEGPLKKFFEKNEIVHYKHEGLGCGLDLATVAEKVNISIPKKDNKNLKTSGYLEFDMEWDKVYEGAKRFDRDKNLEMLNDIVDRNFEIDTDKLKEFCDEAGGQYKDAFPFEDLTEAKDKTLL